MMESVSAVESSCGTSLEAKAEAARQSRPKDCAICFANCCANRCSGCWYCFRIFYPSRPPDSST